MHEWRNVRPTVPVLDLVNLLLGEHAENFLGEFRTKYIIFLLLSFDPKRRPRGVISIQIFYFVLGNTRKA